MPSTISLKWRPRWPEIRSTASAVEARPLQPIFQGDKIVAQLVRLPQPAVSAALVAYVEAHCEGDALKSSLCGTVPFPHSLDDDPRARLATMLNQAQWGVCVHGASPPHQDVFRSSSTGVSRIAAAQWLNPSERQPKAWEPSSAASCWR